MKRLNAKKKKFKAQVDNEEVLTIDPYRLPEEWLEQANHYYKYASKLAKAKRTLDQAKANKDIVIAELDHSIRSNPLVLGINKNIRITDKLVEKHIPLQDKYITANDELIQAKYRVDILAAMVDALEHKKKALENLVYLEGQGINAEPKARSKIDKEVIENAEKRSIRAKKRSSEDD